MERTQTCRLAIVFPLGLLLAAPSLALAQDTSPTCPAFREMAQAAVPSEVGDREVMRRLLSAKVGPQLSKRFDLVAAQRAVKDHLRPDPRCAKDPTRACAYRNLEAGSILHVTPPAGRVVYLNPERRFQAARGVENRVTEEDARQVALGGLGAFGVPLDEAGHVDVQALMAATQDTARRTPTQVLRAEVHVNVVRQIEGTPVLGSRTTAAVGSDGGIARLYVLWPDFRLLPGQSVEATLPRAAVVDRLVEEMARDNPCGTVGKVSARIAYVPSSLVDSSGENNSSEDPEGVKGFVPALEVFVVPPTQVKGGVAGPQVTLAEHQLVLPLLGATRP